MKRTDSTELIPMDAMQAVAVREPMPVAAVAPTEAAPTVAQMLQAVISGGITQENIATVKEALAVCERMEDRNAVRSFNRAFRALQAEIPVIVASSEIPNRGKYERFEDVMRVVSPLLEKHGFSVSFSQDTKDNRIVVTCTLLHDDGYKQSNNFTVRVGGRSDSETQADCKASTTAKRNALLQALNIVIRQDCLQDEDDPRNEGDTITKEQAESLAHRLAMVNGDKAKFLKLAEAPDFVSIKSGKLAVLDEMLRRKEQGK